MKLTANRNCVIEISFFSTATYADPYNDVNLDVVFSGPGGASRRLPAFWGGDNGWHARFSGEACGEYAYRTECSNAEDSGLHGQCGRITVEPYVGSNPLWQHGRLRVASDKRHFEHADGTPFFWVGDTWWMGLCTRLDWPRGFRTLAADRVEKGFNVVQIIAGPYPDMDAWDRRGRNEAGYPLTEGFGGVNTAYFDHADLRIAHLVHSGLMPCIVGMWGYYLPQLGVDRVKRFWRYLVARYGAYPVVWCVCGEGCMPYYLSSTPQEDAALQKRGWSEVMAYIREVDGYDNLITIHPTHYGREQVEDPSLMDFEMLQTGHGDLESVSGAATTVATAVARTPRMPVVNAENNYEGILGRCWQNIQRLCFYHSVLGGTAGHTYGANGIWQMSTVESPYGPSPHGRCWGNTSWSEAALLAGSRQVGLGGRLLQQYRWWECEPHPEWLDAKTDDADPYTIRAVGIPGRLRIVYVPLCWDPPKIRSIEPGTTYQAKYFDPCTGQEHALGQVASTSDGAWTPPLPPEVHDWLLIMVAS